MRTMTLSIVIYTLLMIGLIGCDDDGSPSSHSEVSRPAAPINLNAQSVSATVIFLWWEDKSNNEDGFEIEESVGNADNFNVINSIGRNATSLNLINKQPFTTYYYRIRAYNTGGHSGYSNETSTTTPTLLNRPGNLQARIVSETEIIISWEDNSDDESGFIVEESIGSSRNFSVIDSLDANTTSLTVGDKQADIIYYYRVCAYNDEGPSDYSDDIRITISEPPAPSNLIAQPSSATEILLTWRDRSNNEDIFRIEESVDNDNTFQLIDSTDQDITTLILTGKKVTSTYYYRVQAGNVIGYSSYSDQTSITFLPSTPENLKAVVDPDLFGMEIHLTWNRTSINEDGFNIEERIGDSGNFTLITSTGSGITSVTLNNKQVGTTYHYRVNAFNSFGNSTNSTEVSASIPLWSRTYGGNDRDIGVSIQPTADGGYISVGYSNSSGVGAYDVLMIKFDSECNELWNRTYGGSGGDKGSSVQQTADGGYIITGSTRSYGAGDWDLMLLKTDSEGEQQWMRTFGSTFGEWGSYVQPTADGGYIIVGTTYLQDADINAIWLIKTDGSGNRQWSRIFEGSQANIEDSGLTIHLTQDGGYIIAGSMLIKTNEDGYIQWSRTFGNNVGYNVQLCADGGYIVVADTCEEINYMLLIKTDAGGNEQWIQTFEGQGRGYAVQPTADGGYIVVGETPGVHGIRDSNMWLIKTDDLGLEQWNLSFGGREIDWGSSVHTTTDGGYIIMGS
ncbi:fibronectin type III domain-containing protein, partial [bacterium]|nr:fibronectin type III domain-containing protein [bacterium]